VLLLQGVRGKPPGARLRRHGEAELRPVADQAAERRARALDGCHTTLVGGYVVEGHVPVGAIDRLLDRRPALRGISVPGMPAGSPGMLMPGENPRPQTVYEIAAGAAPGATPKVFSVE
jgi:hypothetical protein